MDIVRVRTPGKYEELSSRPPGRLIMGKTATVEVAGLVNIARWNEEGDMSPAYYIRVDDLPLILIDEQWLEPV
ncbi:MAG TPA: hypothetical protein DCE26_00665 [Dehalococcoidia bacterium]|nr:hypothetical protein [Chloroflexota bacterium]HAA94188.1 hypothetical protein [Dehalococcoidia bacterium]|tara:strand:- start:1896 stop:2114 length:219 start_codon:yes stop_codon:yes gene_type:complete